MNIALPNINLGSTDTIVFLVAGLVAGILASRSVIGRSNGILIDMVVGVIGAFLGRWLFSALNVSLGDGVIPEIVVAFVGALLLLLIVHGLSGGFHRRST